MVTRSHFSQHEGRFFSFALNAKMLGKDSLPKMTAKIKTEDKEKAEQATVLRGVKKLQSSQAKKNMKNLKPKQNDLGKYRSCKYSLRGRLVKVE